MSWEKEFDEKFVVWFGKSERMQMPITFDVVKVQCKDFVRNALEYQMSDLRKEVKKLDVIARGEEGETAISKDEVLLLMKKK